MACAASSSDGSTRASASSTLSVIIGKRCTVSTSSTPCTPYMKFSGCSSPNQSMRSTFTVPARPRMKTKPSTATSGGRIIGSIVR